jgi:hypothetical protein
MTHFHQPRGNSFSAGGRAVHNPGAFAPATQSAPEAGSLLVPSADQLNRHRARVGTRIHELLEAQFAERTSAFLPAGTGGGTFGPGDDDDDDDDGDVSEDFSEFAPTPGAATREVVKPGGGLLRSVPANVTPTATEPDVEDPDIDW